MRIVFDGNVLENRIQSRVSGIDGLCDPSCQPSPPPVAILETHDIVFAPVDAGLHFDHFERHLARVFQTVCVGLGAPAQLRGGLTRVRLAHPV